MMIDDTYKAAFANTSATTNIPWLNDLRTEHFKQFSEQGFPTTRVENWKYTNLDKLAKQPFTLPARKATLLADAIEQFKMDHEGMHMLVFTQGQFSEALSTINRLPKDVILSSLSHTLKTHPEKIQAHLGQTLENSPPSILSLNTAFMDDGVFLQIPDNTVIEQPIQILHINHSEQDHEMTHLRNLVVAGENSQATLIEHYVSLDNYAYFTTAVTEVIAKCNTQINHYKLQQENLASTHLSYLSCHQAQDARINAYQFDLGGALVRNDSHYQLTAPGGECQLVGLYMPMGHQHIDNHTRIDHLSAHTQSNEYYKGVITDRARAVFNGKVIVHPDAQKVNADQANHNLLLSDKAEIDTKPELEIYADDVKCTHGATIGQLDKKALFYLQSRGIDKKTAEDVLTFGFARDVIKKVPLTPLRLLLEHHLIKRLPQRQDIQELLS